MKITGGLRRFLLSAFAAVVCLIYISSCTDDPVGSSTDIINPTIADFPRSVGSEWTYRRTDSIAATVTTVTVTIDAVLPSIPEISSTRWLIADGVVEDTLIVTVNDDSLTLDGNLQEFFAWTGKFVFPFIVGDSWSGLTSFDTVEVVSSERTITPVQTFNRAFLIERQLQLPNQLVVWNHWFVPRIGLVRITYRESFFGPTANEVWELTGYRIE